jgi:hypothetical protein
LYLVDCVVFIFRLEVPVKWRLCCGPAFNGVPVSGQPWPLLAWKERVPLGKLLGKTKKQLVIGKKNFFIWSRYGSLTFLWLCISLKKKKNFFV